MLSESTIVLLFLTVIVVVYVLAAGALARIILRRVRRSEAPGRATLWLERFCLASAFTGVLCFAYGYLVEPYWPEVTHTRIQSRKLAGASRPVRLVHISDLHCDPRPRLEERLPDIVAAQKPDFIVFTGDSINSPAGLPVLKPLLTRLAAVAPTFVVKGNWDSAYWSGHDLFGGTGVRELRGEAARLDVAGASVWVAGVPVGGEGMIEGALAGIPPDAFTVFLHHYPDEILEIARRRKVDLYCAGHTHGGQVALPLYGALITLSRFGKRYEAGLYREGETWLYVTRGVGMEGGPAPRVRFWARPEVTVIDLSGS